MKKRNDWIFRCPKHGIEEGLFCNLAYSEAHADYWVYVEYKPKGIPTSKAQKKEWVRIMNLTRQYNG